MEKLNQLPKTEGCSAEANPADLGFYRAERPTRSVPTEWQQDVRRNDKKCRLALRDSARSIGFIREA